MTVLIAKFRENLRQITTQKFAKKIPQKNANKPTIFPIERCTSV